MPDDADDEDLLVDLSGDDALLAALREALMARDNVPARFVETGKDRLCLAQH